MEEMINDMAEMKKDGEFKKLQNWQPEEMLTKQGGVQS